MAIACMPTATRMNILAGEPASLVYDGPAKLDEDRYFHRFSDGLIVGGHSGSPLLNERTGGVCGMVKKTAGKFSDLGGAGIPTEIIFRELPEIVGLNAAFHQQDSRWRDAVASGKARGQDFRICATLPSRSATLKRTPRWARGSPSHWTGRS